MQPGFAIWPNRHKPEGLIGGYLMAKQCTLCPTARRPVRALYADCVACERGRIGKGLCWSGWVPSARSKANAKGRVYVRFSPELHDFLLEVKQKHEFPNLKTTIVYLLSRIRNAENPQKADKPKRE